MNKLHFTERVREREKTEKVSERERESTRKGTRERATSETRY